MKRSILLLVLVLAMIAICFTACDEPQEHTHSAQKVEAKAATCAEEGNSEYWRCTGCDKVWTDEALTNETTLSDLLIATTEHEYLNECDADCKVCGQTTNPGAEHKYLNECDTDCKICGQTTNPDAEHKYLNECDTNCKNCGELTNPDAEHKYLKECDTDCASCGQTINPGAEHNVQKFEAKAATCSEEGNVEYWSCTYCDKAWGNESLSEEIKISDTVVGKVDHEYTFACDTNCKNCGELTNPDVAHYIKHVEETEATCTDDGNEEYWCCTVCGSAWINEKLTYATSLEDVVISATGHVYNYLCDTHCNQCGERTNKGAKHSLIHYEAKAATCYEDGNKVHWYCEYCKMVFLDANGIRNTNFKSVVIPATHQNLTHTEAVAPDCENGGNIEYWTCQDCDGVWNDADLTQLITINDVALPALGHNNVDGACDKCGKNESEQ